jgi:voltage-gated potassium channel
MREQLPKLGWLLSPSRKLIDLLKQGDQAHRGKMLRRWSFGLFAFELVVCATLMVFVANPSSSEFGVAAVLATIYAASRINEIAYAFYRDPLSKAKRSNLKVGERIRMAMRSYFGLAFNFALLYYFLPVACMFKAPLASFLEAFYFSGVTLATLGYGDLSPVHWLSRLLALYEVFAGILLVAVAIATYIGDRGAGDA